ncbi:hypothetical protein BRADI_5g05195v3 [Brachypodium distachyon]|uniref:Reverse transcriptase zinc-binding domain-containing protein n=1 Tax=Brachypodium distachyon TaxID=15368 RepID=A0A2K2CFK0_BRADI|nr:hypothetical protein BRADI_5g05195v3 [Brachypodium distachyon]
MWQGGQQKKKYHLVKWKLICRPKKKGGLGVKNLRTLNISLLCTWWWRLEAGDGMWQQLVRGKYGIVGSIRHIQPNTNNSPLWRNLLKVRDFYLRGRKMVAGNGRNTDFWGDCWIHSQPLKELFPDLFRICEEQEVSVQYMHSRRWNFRFRRWLDCSLQEQLRMLHDLLFQWGPNADVDHPKWKWTKAGIFSVKSMYSHLTNRGPDRTFRHLWKAKIPLKIKIWMWLIWHDAIATKDNMKKQKWEGDYKCRFCSQNETIHHLFFGCDAAGYVWSIVSLIIGAQMRSNCFSQVFRWLPQHICVSTDVQVAGVAAICWAIWKSRNNACFENKWIKHPVDLICYTCVFLKYWAGLHKQADKEALLEGAAVLQRVALGIHAGEEAKMLEDAVTEPGS